MLCPSPLCDEKSHLELIRAGRPKGGVGRGQTGGQGASRGAAPQGGVSRPGAGAGAGLGMGWQLATAGGRGGSGPGDGVAAGRGQGMGWERAWGWGGSWPGPGDGVGAGPGQGWGGSRPGPGMGWQLAGPGDGVAAGSGLGTGWEQARACPRASRAGGLYRQRREAVSPLVPTVHLARELRPGQQGRGMWVCDQERLGKLGRS